MAEDTSTRSNTSFFALNESAAEAFAEIASLLEIKGENPFKIKAYVKASGVLRELESDLEELAALGDLTSIPGVGKAIADKLEAFLQYGSIPQLDQLRTEVPVGLLKVSGLGGLGPKKTAQLHKELGIVDLETLRAALLDGRVETLKGFTKASQAKILSAVEKVLTANEVYIKSRLEEWAGQTLERVSDLLGVVRSEVVGEVRRLCPYAERIEILVHCESVSLAGDALRGSLRESSVDFEEDGSVFRFHHLGGCPVVLHLGALENAGWNTLVLTGPESFVREVESKASKGRDVVSVSREREVFDKLGLPWIPPELRHRADCFALNQDSLLEAALLVGNLHTHTDASDGESTLQEVVDHARSLGHQYLAITDHSRSLVVANGLTPDRLLRQVDEVRRLNEGSQDFVLLAGSEVDILEHGELDFDDEVLSALDFAVAAVHSFFHLDREKMTERLIRGISHPKVKILAHPTGRILTKREGYSADWRAVFEKCAELRVAVEVNCSPWRLDLSEELLEEAMSLGCLVSVNTDAHSLAEFSHVRHGVDMVRRAGIPMERVVNSWAPDKLQAWFRS